MDNLGFELKKARKSQGMTLEDVHHITKISLKFLESIEDGNFNVLPGVYIRAFLKSYAAAVGISPDKVLKEYDTLMGNVEEEDDTPTQESEKSESIKVTPDLSFVLDWIKDNLNSIIYVFGGLLVTIVAILVLCSRPEKEYTPFNEIIDESAASGINLSVEAQKSMYLMVSIDRGDSLDYYLLSGTSKDFLAKEYLWMLISDAGAAKIIIDGDTLGNIGEDGSTVHFAVDSTGLKILKSYPVLDAGR